MHQEYSRKVQRDKAVVAAEEITEAMQAFGADQVAAALAIISKKRMRNFKQTRRRRHSCT